MSIESDDVPLLFLVSRMFLEAGTSHFPDIYKAKQNQTKQNKTNNKKTGKFGKKKKS